MIYAEWQNEIGEIATFTYPTEEKMDKGMQKLANGIGKRIKIKWNNYTHTDDKYKTYIPENDTQEKKGK